MMKKMMLGFGVLSLAALSAGETYRVNLFQTSVVNGTELKPGEYKVEVTDNKAVIKRGKESVEAPVKLENTDTKFGSTSVRYQNADGKYKVQEIRLGGTKTKLVFETPTASGM